jgi:hypothetical protein
LAEVDILGPSDRRRIWCAEEKAALLAEIDAEGGKVRLGAWSRGGAAFRRACSIIGAQRASRRPSRRVRPKMFSSFRSACSGARGRADPVAGAPRTNACAGTSTSGRQRRVD